MITQAWCETSGRVLRTLALEPGEKLGQRPDGACGVRGCLGALTERPGDGVGSRLYAELGF